jgi:hypothetical protein
MKNDSASVTFKTPVIEEKMAKRSERIAALAASEMNQLMVYMTGDNPLIVISTFNPRFFSSTREVT